MDRCYVRNFVMSLNDMRYIARTTSKPLDIHLMIEHPNNNIGLFLAKLLKGDTVYIHPEAVSPVYDFAENHQCGGDSGHCHQPRHICGNGHGDAADCEEGSGHVRESRQCGTYVIALCRREDNQAPDHTTLLFGKQQAYGKTLRNIRDLRF